MREDSRAAVIGANELKPLSLTLCKRYDSLFLVHFQPELSNTDSTRHTRIVCTVLCIATAYTQCNTVDSDGWHSWCGSSLLISFSLFLSTPPFFFRLFVRSVCVSSRFYGFCSVFLGIYFIILSLFAYVCASMFASL